MTPRRAQLRRDVGLRRAAVDEHREAARRLEQRRVALADVEERDGEVRGWCAVRGREAAARQPATATSAHAPSGDGSPPSCVRATAMQPPRMPRQRRVGDRQPRRPIDPDLARRRRAAARSSGRRRRRRRGRSRSARSAARPGTSDTCAAAALSMPIHITGANRRQRGQVRRAAPRATRARSGSAISGAVASVAATVSAAPMRSGSGRRAQRARRAGARARRCPTTAAKLSCQPTSCHARGSSASVTRGGEQQRVPARRRTARERRHRRRPTPIAPGPHDRGPGAGERHVERDQRPATPIRRPRRPSPAAAEQRPREHRQQRHVLPADRQHVREPRALEVVAHAGRGCPRPRRAPSRARARASRRRQPGARRRARRAAAPRRRLRPGRRAGAPVEPHAVGVQDRRARPRAAGRPRSRSRRARGCGQRKAAAGHDLVADRRPRASADPARLAPGRSSLERRPRPARTDRYAVASHAHPRARRARPRSRRTT